MHIQSVFKNSDNSVTPKRNLRIFPYACPAAVLFSKPDSINLPNSTKAVFQQYPILNQSLDAITHSRQFLPNVKKNSTKNLCVISSTKSSTFKHLQFSLEPSCGSMNMQLKKQKNATINLIKLRPFDRPMPRNNRKYIQQTLKSLNLEIEKSRKDQKKQAKLSLKQANSLLMNYVLGRPGKVVQTPRIASRLLEATNLGTAPTPKNNPNNENIIKNIKLSRASLFRNVAKKHAETQMAISHQKIQHEIIHNEKSLDDYIQEDSINNSLENTIHTKINDLQTPAAETIPPTVETKQLNSAIIPLNLEEQEKLFFESGCSINPRFAYMQKKKKGTAKFLNLYTKPEGNLLPLAVKILDNFIAEFGSESNYLSQLGDMLDIAETTQIFEKYIAELGLQDKIKICFSSNTVSPTFITHDPKNLTSTVTIGLPIEYRKKYIQGVLDHEIGTHFLRKYNNQFQPWKKQRQKLKLKKYISTEEGLASLNQLFHIVFFSIPYHKSKTLNNEMKPFLYKPALYYFACCQSEHMSFVELFESLAKYVDNPKRRFKICVRAKRGLENTSMSGGLYKDKAYFEGAVKILQKRREIDFELLYSGKISIDDLQKIKTFKDINRESIKLPKFIKDKEKYMEVLDKISEINFI